MKMQKKFLFLVAILFIIISSQFVLSSTITMDKESYALSETVSVTINCAGNEKNQDYTVVWKNTTGFEIPLANDTRNTGDCTTLLEDFIINSTYIDAYGVGLNVSLIGSNLEGVDNASITTAGSNIILISSITHQGTFLGLSSSIDSNVADENGKAISGGLCDANVEDPSNDQVLFTRRSTMIDGNLDFIWNLDYQRFKENKDYVAKISCFCGSIGSIYECIDEDGVNFNNSIGSSDVAFTTASWLTFNEEPFPTTLDNNSRKSFQTLFAGFDDIHWLRNVSNNNPDLEPIEVRTRTILVKNDSKQIFGIINEGVLSRELDGFPNANSTSFRHHQLSQSAETGIYIIRIIYDVIYKNLFQVAQYIEEIGDFNITSVQDTFQINSAEVHDFFGAEVRLNSTTDSRSTPPEADNTTTHVVLTESFNFDFCINANNTRGGDIEVFVHELTLENPTLQTSQILISDHILGNEQVIDYEAVTNNEEVCISLNMPSELVTHSDYRFAYDIHIGTESIEFDCGESCEFEGHTDFFYVLKLTDMIEMPKFINNPTATRDGNPGIRIVTRRGEFLPMFNDINYTNQQDTDWGNSTSTCLGKDDGVTQACNYSIFPRAGEDIKICFEGRNYFSSEVFVNLFDLYIDNDQGDSQILLSGETELEVGIKSVSDNDLYAGTAPSRVQEADGNLTDGYANYCTDWMKLPNNVVGGNSWDVQGRATMDPHLYDLTGDKNWDWESDEFPIFGLFNKYPTWNLHLFDPIHYRIPERWDRILPNQYSFNLTIPFLGSNAGIFDFGEHLPFRLLDQNTPFERLINITITYQNGSAITHNTSLFTQFEEIVFLIENVNTSSGNNNFTLTAYNYDFENRTVTALERTANATEEIANKTGTFRLSIDCPATGIIGTDMECSITAQVEDSQTVEKEVDFTCYILLNGKRYSSQNFNRMITRTPLIINRNFLIPAFFLENIQATLQCEAGYYNFGSRTDTFSDSFVTTNPSGIVEGIFKPFLSGIGEIIDDIIKVPRGSLIFILFLFLGGLFLASAVFLVIKGFIYFQKPKLDPY